MNSNLFWNKLDCTVLKSMKIWKNEKKPSHIVQIFTLMIIDGFKILFCSNIGNLDKFQKWTFFKDLEHCAAFWSTLVKWVVMVFLLPLKMQPSFREGVFILHFHK